MNDEDIARRYIRKIDNCRNNDTVFELSFYDFKRIVTAKRCKYTKVKLVSGTENMNKPNYVTLDRIDNSKGYVAGNVVACSNSYNQFKSVIENPSNPMTADILLSALKTQKRLMERK